MNLFFLGTPDDQAYLPRLKPLVGVAQVSYSLEPISTWREVQAHCDRKGIKQIFTTSSTLLAILLYRQNEKKKPSIDSYAGSVFRRDGYEILIVNPLSHIIRYRMDHSSCHITSVNSHNLPPGTVISVTSTGQSEAPQIYKILTVDSSNQFCCRVISKPTRKIWQYVVLATLLCILIYLLNQL